MSQNIPGINLEIFAPSFSLPTHPEERVQAQILFPSTQQVLPAQQSGEQEPRVQQGAEMCQLRMQNIPVEGHAFLLQILRQWRAGERVQQAQLTDEMAIMLEVRSSAAAGTTGATTSGQSGQATLIPGVNRIVIFLDKEGKPASYSIDSAES